MDLELEAPRRGLGAQPGRQLLVAPRSLRAGLVEQIETETEHARAGRPASIALKLNSIVDETLVDALYRASQAGVPVDVVVRGICAIRPGVPGLSETIRVRSVSKSAAESPGRYRSTRYCLIPPDARSGLSLHQPGRSPDLRQCRAASSVRDRTPSLR